MAHQYTHSWTGLIKLTPFEDITYDTNNGYQSKMDAKEGPSESLNAICDFLNYFDASLWLCEEVCATSDPPAEFLYQQIEQRHYHYIIQCNCHEAPKDSEPETTEEYIRVKDLVNSISITNVRTLPGLAHWLDQYTTQIHDNL